MKKKPKTDKLDRYLLAIHFGGRNRAKLVAKGTDRAMIAIFLVGITVKNRPDIAALSLTGIFNRENRAVFNYAGIQLKCLRQKQ